MGGAHQAAPLTATCSASWARTILWRSLPRSGVRRPFAGPPQTTPIEKRADRAGAVAKTAEAVHRSELGHSMRHEAVGGRLVLGWLAVTGPIAFTISWIVAEVLQDGYGLRRELHQRAGRAGRAARVDHDDWFSVARRWQGCAWNWPRRSALEGRLARIGSILVALAGVGIIVAGLARVDCCSRLAACAAGSTLATRVLACSATHEFVSLLIFLALVAAPLVLARAFSGGAPVV